MEGFEVVAYGDEDVNRLFMRSLRTVARTPQVGREPTIEGADHVEREMAGFCQRER
jgi:hypothetical protein